MNAIARAIARQDYESAELLAADLPASEAHEWLAKIAHEKERAVALHTGGFRHSAH